MNIFFLSMDPSECATYHVDRHVVKMILESAQLLCTCWHVLDPNGKTFSPPMRKTHVNHPCARWVRESSGNYRWLCRLALCLCAEYTHRYGRVHASERVIRRLSELTPAAPASMTRLPQAMPEEYRVDGDAVAAYRRYYVHGKSHLHAWKRRDVPPFVRRAVTGTAEEG